MLLKIHAVIPVTKTLGPGQRYAIWVQGCPLSCVGCMTPAALDPTGGTLLDVSRIAADILLTPGIEGITISGGEPFAQATALAQLICLIRTQRDLGVIVYSGYPHAHLVARPDCVPLLECIDLLIDSPFQANRNDGGQGRGSSNQRAILLTPRYAAGLTDWFGKPGRAVEVHLNGPELMLVGVPGHAALSQWMALRQAGEPESSD